MILLTILKIMILIKMIMVLEIVPFLECVVSRKSGFHLCKVSLWLSYCFYYQVPCGRDNEDMSLIVEFFLNPVKPVSSTVATSSQTTFTGK